MVRLTILIDDINGSEIGYKKSFGFAALIEKDNKRILFDTGTYPEPLLANLKAYGISPSSIDAIILSHNHNDHTDGLPGILRENDNIPIYVNKDWEIPVSYQGKGIPKKNLVVNKEACECSELINGIFLTNSHFSSDYGRIYEHACYIDAGNSFILLCGCCHPGLNKFLQDRTQLGISLESDLHVIGGMHGFKFSESEAEKLDSIVKSVILCHCTMYASDYRRQFGNICSIGIVGRTLKF